MLLVWLNHHPNEGGFPFKVSLHKELAWVSDHFFVVRNEQIRRESPSNSRVTFGTFVGIDPKMQLKPLALDNLLIPSLYRSKAEVAITIPLPTRVLKYLKELLIRANGSECLFPNRRTHKAKQRFVPISPDTINTAFKKLLTLDKLPIVHLRIYVEPAEAC